MTTNLTTRRLGASGPIVGAIAYGCWRFGGTDTGVALAKIDAALECGMTLIDTADIYGYGDERAGFGGAESLLGAVLASAPSLRNEMVIATKGGIQPGVPYDSTRSNLINACDASLARLGISSVDLYQVHRPDLFAHPGEVAAALAEIVESGRATHVGVSNYSASQFAALNSFAPGLLATIQPEFSLWHHAPIDDGILDQAMQHHVTPLAWSPLGRGAIGDITTPLGAAVATIAEAHAVSPTAIALAWVLQHPSRPIPIIGTQQVARIRDAATASHVTLTRTEWYTLLNAAGRELP